MKKDFSLFTGALGVLLIFSGAFYSWAYEEHLTMVNALGFMFLAYVIWEKDSTDVVDRQKLIEALIKEKDDPRHANSPNLRTGLAVAIQVVKGE
jgi:hypothetical protein